MNEDNREAIIGMLVISVILILLSIYVSAYFYIISIPFVLFFFGLILQECFPSIWAYLFKKKNIITPNGKNVFYNKSKIENNVRMYFFKKNNILHGEFCLFDVIRKEEILKANFVNGKIHGESWDRTSISRDSYNSRALRKEKNNHGVLIYEKVLTFPEKRIFEVDQGNPSVFLENKYTISENKTGLIIQSINILLSEINEGH
jgi:hypothetical protein